MPTATKGRKTAKKAPPVNVTMSVFDTGTPIYRVKREAVPIGDFVPLTAKDYKPRGGTPLRDATAQLIAHLDGLRMKDCVTVGLLLDESGSMGGNEAAVIAGVNQFVDGMSDVKSVDPNAAGTVLAVIVTDGYENSSREVDHATLARMVSDREADGWTFIFLGAAIDAWAQSASLGMSGGVTGQSVSYQNTPTGTMSALASVSADSVSYLQDVGAYKTMRTNTSQRSVTESGEEVADNINAPGQPTTSYGNVNEAIEKAKGATQK